MADTRSLIRMQHETDRIYCDSFNRAPATMVLNIDETFDDGHGDQQMSLFIGYYGGYGYQPILVFEEAGRLVASVLRPAGRPSGKEVACHIRRLMRPIRRHWPKTRILLRADGHYNTPEAMDQCDTLGVDYEFGLPTTSRVCEHVETREATTAKRYKQHYADTGKTEPVRYVLPRSTVPVHKAKNTASLRTSRSGLTGATRVLSDQSDQPSQQVSLLVIQICMLLL